MDIQVIVMHGDELVILLKIDSIYDEIFKDSDHVMIDDMCQVHENGVIYWLHGVT